MFTVRAIWEGLELFNRTTDDEVEAERFFESLLNEYSTSRNVAIQVFDTFTGSVLAESFID